MTVTRDRNFRRYRAVHDVLRTVGPGFIPGTPKWNRAHSSAIPQVASSTVCRAVRVSADVPVKPVTAFRAFTDPVIYSAWLGSKVTLDGTHFTCMLPWGRTVRGFYDATVATSLIAMRWDFETDAVPVPGHELTAYLRFDRWGRGTRIEVQQLIGSDDHAVFMERVWTWVLGSYATNHRRRPRRS